MSKYAPVINCSGTHINGYLQLLRLVIMSATLRISDMAENKTLFATPPPTINVAGRQHPVTIHFSRRTDSDYVTEAIRKTIKIHNRLPPGGILIFLTGQNEIVGVCRKLEARFGPRALSERKRKYSAISNCQRASGDSDLTSSTTVSSNQGDLEAEDMDFGLRREELATDVDDYVMDTGENGSDAEALDTDNEEEDGMEDNWDDVGGGFSRISLLYRVSHQHRLAAPMHIVPLYSLLPGEKQIKVFEPPPEGSRLVVVATNIAETSLTIPNIRYVVDCGRAKEVRLWVGCPRTGSISSAFLETLRLGQRCSSLSSELDLESFCHATGRSCWTNWSWPLLSTLLLCCV